MPADLALDTVDGLSNAIHDSGVIFGSGNVNIPMKTFVSGSIYCGRCRGLRRVRIQSSALFDGQGGSYTGIGLQFKVHPSALRCLRFFAIPVFSAMRSGRSSCTRASTTSRLHCCQPTLQWEGLHQPIPRKAWPSTLIKRQDAIPSAQTPPQFRCFAQHLNGYWKIRASRRRCSDRNWLLSTRL